jgi:tetratricopeptide (TPR) repeat protein
MQSPMKKLSSCLFPLVSGASLLVRLLYPSLSVAATVCDPAVAKMVSVQGSVEVRRAGRTEWRPARLNDIYCPGDRIQVGERSRAEVALASQPLLRLDQNSTITLGGVKQERTSLVELLKGAMYFFSRSPRSLEVHTAFVNAGIEGTEGLIVAAADRSLISVFEGKVLAANGAGSLVLTGGQSAVAEQGRAPVFTVIARPRDAVQWALYYPPALYFRPEEFQAGPAVQGALRTSIASYMKGDFQTAFESLREIPETIAEPRFFSYRASLLLAVGRVDEALADIERALRLNPASGDALALRAITAVVKGDRQNALGGAKKAVAADPNSSAALIALSYAQQANFDLEGARNALKQAVQISPENALAWARLAELEMSFAELDEALEAAKKAAALNPNLSRTQTVLGFAYLTQVDTAEAKKAFDKAIELDQADPLPRLGLGLARIREGDLPEGRREIEIAASLDANNSIFRSYLGKAYFEEKRAGADEREYAIAKELDPKDPTPWFYDAIQKQTTNRPVEALRDVEKAIELNDNRAVYRSRLLLDSDLAARSAGLGRIYGDLGFEQLALVEGWKSVETDPANFSAHRLLADSYAILPRHEIARVSELLQSQLLQPLNATPIQPRLAESNLFLVGAGGPGALSFNEFNPLFNRNGVTFQGTGLAGENSTYAGEGVLAGIYNKASFSVGGFRFQTEGWRANSDQMDNIGNAFVQWQISPRTSVQAEYRYRRTVAGEVRLRFEPDDFLPNRRREDTTQSGRLGFQHAFAPNSRLIGNFTYQDADRLVRDRPVPADLFGSLRGRDQAVSGELQHLFRSAYVNIVSGLGHFNIDSADKNTIMASAPPGIVTLDEFTTDKDVRHTNLYLYTYTRLPQNLILTLGASGDFFDTDLPGAKNPKQFNPKFGLSWSPIAATTIRGAVFRTLKRTLITNQTLEPTQVAGFNQFFDDLNATKSWRYGVAVDQKLPGGVFGGVEYTFRDSEVPFIGSTAGGIGQQEVDWKEKLLRAYLFWTPHDRVALSAGYEWERFDREELFADGAKRVEMNRVPLGVNYFHPLGLSASLKATYINQRGAFQRIAATAFESGHDDFWTVDAAISYRLPKRRGFITIGAKNLFDQKFKYFDPDRSNARVIPDRVFFTRLTLALP